MSFTGIQRTLTYTQTNTANPEQVFPLLCPVRERDWLDGWDYTMIHSESGLAEKDCVFITPHHGPFPTIWHITQYDRKSFLLEFLRVTPGDNVVRINIALFQEEINLTRARISYQYTALSEEQNTYIKEKLEGDFLTMMHWWEKALNHYLATGEKLMKQKV